MNIDDILLEWSYQCPKGYPTIVDGKFVDRKEVIILNKILVESGFSAIELPTEAASVASVSSNPTDAKEALVMVFYDCFRTTSGFANIYSELYKQPTQESLKKLDEALANSYSLASDYGEGVNVENLHKYIVEVLSAPDRKKTNKELVNINNGFSAAHTIFTNNVITQYVGKGSGYLATRGELFNQIRSDAKTLFQTINVKLNFPDNWCPGDFYLVKSTKVPEASNILQLNSNFKGPGYENGTILAISLKMESAQAGKGTTFLETVLADETVTDVELASDDANLANKYMEAKRYIKNYTDISDIKKSTDKLKSAYNTLYVVSKTKNIKMPLVDQWYNSPKETKQALLAKNRAKMAEEFASRQTKIDSVLLGQQNVENFAQEFRNSYTEFAKYIRTVGIKNVKAENVNDFISRIRNSKSALKEGGPTKILVKKAECYRRAIRLIKGWSNKNKKISEPFKSLGAVNNPLLAITLFAIAQHGANPNFVKVHGSDTGPLGTAEMFPAKSKVDQDSLIQSLTINDSEGAAGFDVEYNVKLNKTIFKTTLTFRFSSTQFRVEVQELEVVK